MNQPKVIQFPVKGKRQKQKAVRNLDTTRYFSENQIKSLRRTVRSGAGTGRLSDVRAWLAVDVLTSSGLRVSELCDLRVSDIKAAYGQNKIFVRNGKGGVAGSVTIPDSLKKHIKQFLAWKEARGEPTGPDDHVLQGQRGPMTTQAVQQLTKKYLRLCGLYEPGKSCHSLRHSYAVQVYRQERDLRAVQKQLRHTSIQSTMRYADVTDEDLAEQVKGLWG